MLVMVTLAAVRLTVPVNQAEETSRQLHIAQLATATYIVIYRVFFLTGPVQKVLKMAKSLLKLSKILVKTSHFLYDTPLLSLFW